MSGEKVGCGAVPGGHPCAAARGPGGTGVPSSWLEDHQPCVGVCAVLLCLRGALTEHPPASPAFSPSRMCLVSVPGPPLLWAAPWELMSTGQADTPGVTRHGPDSILSPQRHVHGHTRLNFLCGSPQMQPVDPGHTGCGARRSRLPALPPRRPVPVHVPLARGHHLRGLQLRHLPPS